MAKWDCGLTKENDQRIANRAKAISEGQKRNHSQKKTQEWRDKISATKRAQHRVSPFKGLTAQENESLARGVNALIAVNQNRSAEHSMKISEAKKGIKPICAGWNKGLTKETNTNIAKMASNPERNKKIRDARIKLQTEHPEFVQWLIKQIAKKPTKPEMVVMAILNQYYPNQWKYVGNGALITGGKCPDFANINGKKQFIEVFGSYWHRGENPQILIDHYKQYGFDTLVIWQDELKDIDKVIARVKDFSSAETIHEATKTG